MLRWCAARSPRPLDVDKIRSHLFLARRAGAHAMTISMYKSSVPIFVQFLTSLSGVLDKAAAYAEAKKVDPAVMLNTRLAPEMFPLVRQVREENGHGVHACRRLQGVGLA